MENYVDDGAFQGLIDSNVSQKAEDGFELALV